MNAQEDTIRRMKDIAQAVNERLPEEFGFFVMCFPKGDVADSRANYASNCRREDVIRAMKEWLIKCGAGEDWMKHIK